MEKGTALKILRERHKKALFPERTALETLIPELAGNATGTGTGTESDTLQNWSLCDENGNETLYSWSLCDADGNEFASGEVKEKSTEFVDLGLPSGTLWAACNVGANAPEEYGGHYTWEDAMKFANMPTKEQIKELIKECHSEWSTRKGVHGRLFTGPNGNVIFLPFCGIRERNRILGTLIGEYWSATPHEFIENRAYQLSIDAGDACSSVTLGVSLGGSSCNFGQSVREVRKP